SRGMGVRRGRLRGGLRMRECSMCTYRTPYPFNLRRHMIIHSGQDDHFSCDVCPFTCVSKAVLEMHLRSHPPGAGQPFQCPYCRHSSRQKHNLKQHIDRKHKLLI
ncbi:Zinc finger C2H2-type, partial [Trinorchestia longiramus]